MTNTPKTSEPPKPCSICKQELSSGGRKTCDSCAEKNRIDSREKNAGRREAGICISCGLSPFADHSTSYCDHCLKKRREQKQARYYKCKDAVFEAYGGYRCGCCGETTKPFLTIDHIDGGGVKHRKEIGIDFYVWLARNNFPDGYQVLCMNCQFGRKFCGVCPHAAGFGPENFLPDHMG